MEQTDSSSPSSKASSMESGPNSLTSGSPTLATPAPANSEGPPVYHNWPSHLDIYNHHPLPHYYPPAPQQLMPLGFNFPGVPWPDHVIPNPYAGIHPTILPVNPYPPAVAPPQKKSSYPPKRKHRSTSGPEETRSYKQPFTEGQKSILMERFRKGYKINLDERKALGAKIGLTHEQVRTWFANQRAREKLAEKQKLMKMQLMTVDEEQRLDHWTSCEPGYIIERIS